MIEKLRQDLIGIRNKLLELGLLDHSYQPAFLAVIKRLRKEAEKEELRLPKTDIREGGE